MKKALILILTFICAGLMTVSCNKDDENGISNKQVPFIGSWFYTGTDMSAEDDLSFFDNYLFMIDDKSITVYKIDRISLNTTYSYTRKKNKITFTPKFNGKYQTATISNVYGTGAESICWDCGKGQVYNFKKVE